MRMINRVDANRQPGPYMWVLTAESPLGLGPLYVPRPFQCKEKVDFFVKPVEILPVPLWEESCSVLKSAKRLSI
jgi:hypothetical protein